MKKWTVILGDIVWVTVATFYLTVLALGCFTQRITGLKVQGPPPVDVLEMVLLLSALVSPVMVFSVKLFPYRHVPGSNGTRKLVLLLVLSVVGCLINVVLIYRLYAFLRHGLAPALGGP
jgi:hypothetical protein